MSNLFGFLGVGPGWGSVQWLNARNLLQKSRVRILAKEEKVKNVIMAKNREG